MTILEQLKANKTQWINFARDISEFIEAILDFHKNAFMRKIDCRCILSILPAALLKKNQLQVKEVEKCSPQIFTLASCVSQNWL